MTEFRLVPFRREYGEYLFEQNIKDNIKVLCDNINPDDVMKVWESNGTAYTLLLDDIPIGSAGIVNMGWNRGEAWTLVCSQFYKYRKTCFKLIRNMLEVLAKDMKLIRVQSLINENISCKDIWMKHLGFKCETPEGMRGFGPNGETFYQYSRIFT